MYTAVIVKDSQHIWLDEPMDLHYLFVVLSAIEIDPQRDHIHISLAK